MAETIEECHDDTRMNYYAKACYDKDTELKKYIDDELLEQLKKIDKIDSDLQKLKNMDYPNNKYRYLEQRLLYYKERL